LERFFFKALPLTVGSLAMCWFRKYKTVWNSQRGVQWVIKTLCQKAGIRKDALNALGFIKLGEF
jgi:hypothetical protein